MGAPSELVALHEAHEKGLIHRDVKPGNIMLTAEDGEPVILELPPTDDLERRDARSHPTLPDSPGRDNPGSDHLIRSRQLRRCGIAHTRNCRAEVGYVGG